MKKSCLLTFILAAFIGANANAQFLVKKKKKKEFVETEQEAAKPSEFQVNGFARDRDERKVRKANPNNDQLNGFDNNAYLARDAKQPAAEEQPTKAKKGKKSKGTAQAKPGVKKVPRNRDIEALMNDLVLAKIQRPVFRGIMTEHLRDVTTVMANEVIEPAERNVLLKQLYALRNKRLQEVLNDDQFRKWLRIKDEDEFLDLPVPEEV